MVSRIMFSRFALDMNIYRLFIFSDDTGDDRFVPVLLNSEESTLRFVDRPLDPKVSR